MAEHQAFDHLARLEAQREFVRPLVIEAGAGTGKTATLVARILAWCLATGWKKSADRLIQGPAPADQEELGRTEDDRIAAATLARVTAITFTEAAAAEMSQRVTSALAQVERGERPVGFTILDSPAGFRLSDAIARRRAGALLGAADQLQVRTIHSFCRKMLGTHPFEAGLHPQFTVDADASLLREIVESVVERALLAGYDDPGDADYLALAGRGHGPMEIANTVFELASAGWTPQAFTDDPLAPERRQDLLERLWTATNRLQTLLETRRVAGTRARNAAAMLEALGRLRRHLRQARRSDEVDLAQLQTWLDDTLPANLTHHLRLWARGGTANQAEKERLAGARGQLLPLADELHRLCLHLGRLDLELLASSRRVLPPLLGEVQEEMRKRGILGFADLLREAENLAAQHPEIIARLRQRMDQLLVDEFQDTDARQCELIRQLALDGPADERPGLFVVGDPKQSIYGWRNADLSAYEGFVAAAQQAGGRLLVLDENFRSSPAILDEVERLIAPVMRRRPGFQPEFRPLKASSPAKRDGASPSHPHFTAIEHWLSWHPNAKDPSQPAEAGSRATHELEARALATDLLVLHRRGTSWSDVGILLRSLTDVETYLAALREAGIPFFVSRDRQYYRRREIIDADALVRAVLAPEDRLALLTFLRSVAVGVPDAALLPLWSADLPRLLAEPRHRGDPALTKIRHLATQVAQSLPTDIPGIERVRGWHHNLVHAASCLAELRHSFDHKPVDLFVDQLRHSTLFEACESARYLGVYRQANLDRFFSELLAALEQDDTSLVASQNQADLSTAGSPATSRGDGNRHRVLRRLRHRINSEAEAEEARPGEAAEDAVQVLTIHKAKGLEFRHVYLLQMHKDAGQRSTASLEVGEIDGLVEYRFFGAATPGFDQLTAHRDAVARAELVRTFYVAVTRAAQRLVLVGRPPLKSAAPILERAATHQHLALHRQGDAPTDVDLAEIWSQGVARVTRGEVSWVFPALLKAAPDASEEAPADRAMFPSTDVLRAAQSQLRHLCLAAARRMARPFRQVASKIGAEKVEAEETEAVDAAAEQLSTAYLPPPEPAASEVERRAAMAAGSAIHRVLETFDFASDPGEEIRRRHEELADLVELFTIADEAPRALRRAEKLFDHFARGPLFERFLALGKHLVARELPVLLPPSEDDEEAAVGFVAGIVDLVYRDPESGLLVIADYKTDAITSSEEAERHAKRYTAQGEVYVRAVEEMLGLDERPRFELWYLAVGHVEVCVVDKRGHEDPLRHR